jgi:hypothetical protein
MNTKEVADLFLAAVGKVEFYWNFYVVMLLALIGWLVTSKTPFGTHVKLIVTVGYLLFALMNVIGLWGAYTIAEALRLDLLAVAKETNRLAHSVDVISARSFEGQRTLAVAIHVIFGAVVLTVIWFRNRSPQTEEMNVRPGAR